jgi:general secretion pathway protein D
MVIKTWLVAALIASSGLFASWGQAAALLDDVKIPLLAQAEVTPPPTEAAPAAPVAAAPVAPAPAEAAPAAPVAAAPVAPAPAEAAPAAATAVIAPVEAPPAPVPAPAAVLEPVKIPEATPAPAPVVELIEEPAAKPAPEAAAPAEAVPPAAPAEAAPAAPAEVTNTVVVDNTEAANILSQQIVVRKTEQELKAKKALVDANLALKRQAYSEAAALYQQVLNGLPVRPENNADRDQASKGLSEAQFYVINSLVAQDRLQEALTMAEAANKRDPENRKLEKSLTSVQEEIADQADREKRMAQEAAKRPGNAPEFQAQRGRVNDLIRQGRSFLSSGDYKRAADCFKSALSIDPENKSAMRWLEETGERRYDSSTVERKATAATMISDARDTWNPRDYKYIAPPDKATTTNAPADQDLVKKMNDIMIPEIEFRQANIHDVVDFLVKASIAEDTTTDNPRDKGVNIILNLGGSAGSSPVAPSSDPFATTPAPGASSPSISGVPEITFTARYISLFQAIKIITSVAGLKYRVEGKIVMIVPMDAPEGDIEHKWYSVEPTFIDIINKGAGEGGGGDTGLGVVGADLNTRVSGGRGDIEAYFKGLGVEFPKGSSVQYQQSIGKLIVANTARNLSLIERILQEINVVPKQVEIEARFVEVNQSDLEELGFEWLLNDNWEVLTKKGAGAMPGGGERIQIAKNSDANGFTSGLRFFGQQDAGTLTPAVGGSVGSMMKIQSVLTNPDISLILHALERNGNADVLSAPKVTTRSGSEATIRVVTEYIYPTEFDIRSGSDLVGSGSSSTATQPVEAKVVALPQNFETREVGVILSVIPEVSPEGNMINLNMRPEVVSDPTWKEYGVTLTSSSGDYQVSMPQPFFQRRAVETQISIYDGATVVMGGLITEKIVTINDKIPFLGDIPLIGFLFRNKGTQSEKRNLLIFVTARLVDPAGKPIRTQKADDTTPGIPVAASR